ncbi:MAG: hypothetical protein IID34_16145 [Planctomycetes bacterium]|nr:hypothetical protein [Planctomycetota bacterium]
MRIQLRIDRGASDMSASSLLDAAGRALTEAQVNLNHSSLQTPQTLTQEQVVALSNKLASEAWDAGELPGEAPISRLHNEPSGWAGSDPESDESEKIPCPWLILAADVLDFTALLMGTSDSLVLEVQT